MILLSSFCQLFRAVHRPEGQRCIAFFRREIPGFWCADCRTIVPIVSLAKRAFDSMNNRDNCSTMKCNTAPPLRGSGMLAQLV
jgi:hypothetical protein